MSKFSLDGLWPTSEPTRKNVKAKSEKTFGERFVDAQMRRAEVQVRIYRGF